VGPLVTLRETRLLDPRCSRFPASRNRPLKSHMPQELGSFKPADIKQPQRPQLQRNPQPECSPPHRGLPASAITLSRNSRDQCKRFVEAGRSRARTRTSTRTRKSMNPTARTCANAILRGKVEETNREVRLRRSKFEALDSLIERYRDPQCLLTADARRRVRPTSASDPRPDEMTFGLQGRDDIAMPARQQSAQRAATRSIARTNPAVTTRRNGRCQGTAAKRRIEDRYLAANTVSNSGLDRVPANKVVDYFSCTRSVADRTRAAPNQRWNRKEDTR